jgi:hypothetical protein
MWVPAQPKPFNQSTWIMFRTDNICNLTLCTKMWWNRLTWGRLPYEWNMRIITFLITLHSTFFSIRSTDLTHQPLCKIYVAITWRFWPILCFSRVSLIQNYMQASNISKIRSFTHNFHLSQNCWTSFEMLKQMKIFNESSHLILVESRMATLFFL